MIYRLIDKFTGGNSRIKSFTDYNGSYTVELCPQGVCAHQWIIYF